MCVYIVFTYFIFYKSIFSYTDGLYIRQDIFHNLWVWSVLAMSCGTFVSAIKSMIWFALLNVISIKLQCGCWYGCGSNRNRFQKLLCVVHLEEIWIRIQPIWTACSSFLVKPENQYPKMPIWVALTASNRKHDGTLVYPKWSDISVEEYLWVIPTPQQQWRVKVNSIYPLVKMQ